MSATLSVYQAGLVAPARDGAVAAAEQDAGTASAAGHASAAAPTSATSAPASSDISPDTDAAKGAGTAASDDGATATESAATGTTDTANSLAGGYPDGFTGTLALQNLESFDEQTVGEALSRMTHLISWGQALQARLINRMGELFRDDMYAASEQIDPGLAFSLAASECATILNVPQVTGQRLLSEAGQLCGTHTATLTGLEEGRFSYQHAQVVLEQCQNVPAEKLPGFEADLLAAAEGQTRAQFSAKARRLREKNFPETVSKRHLTAFEQRKVTLDREEDGMSCLSAHLRAEDAQHIYTTLTTAARGEQVGGDSRTTDQLRADILAQLLMGGSRGLFTAVAGTPDAAGIRRGTGRTGNDTNAAEILDETGVRRGGGRTGKDTGAAAQDEERTGSGGGSDSAPDGGFRPDSEIPRAEIMVLISAETLFGADDQPAELHGYGPISAEAARRLARNAAGWTGLAQDPQTGEILGVGRRRKVPAGLRRWLRARDGTCRFPGCRVSTANSDVDHTIDWARGGPTDHGNLEHLCRRHHRFKTLGYWKACQPVPGVIEWTSPIGRVYRTEPFLELGPPKQGSPHSAGPREEPGRTDQEQVYNHEEAVPPF